METIKTIYQRRSIRQYDSTPLTKQQLDTIIQAGRQSPSAFGWQQFRFIAIQNPQILHRLDRISAELLKDEYEAENFFGSPQIILVTGRRDNGCCYIDAACAMTLMMLAATDLGLGSCWNNQFFTISDQPLLTDYLTSLSITTQEVICGCLVVGHPASDHHEDPKDITSDVRYFE